MKPTILVIDDDEDMIDLFAISLKKVFSVKSELIASNAINKAIEVKPKVVLLDLHMPNVDGYEVLMQFRNHPQTVNLPVICSSADTSDSARDRAYSLGAIGFIKKPPNRKQLANDINGFLSSINPHMESSNGKFKYTIAFNEDEKNFLIKSKIEDLQATSNKTMILSWKDGKDFFKNGDPKGISNESLVYLKIKPTLITRFPYMQELAPIVTDIKAFIKGDFGEFDLILDEPTLLFDQQESSNSSAKIFSLTEVLSESFASISCFSTMQRDPQKGAFTMGLAKAFVGAAS